MKLTDNLFNSIPDLGKRRESFQFILEKLIELGRPVTIVETGTTRAPHHFEGDGCSTVIWDKFNNLFTKNESTVISIDFDIDAIHKAMSATRSVNFVCDDSVTHLRELTMKGLAIGIDLLYLDSFDFYPGIEIESMTHHLAEISSIYHALPVGCYIMVDDCHAFDTGKHVMVNSFLWTLGVKPIFTGYQYIWRKP